MISRKTLTASLIQQYGISPSAASLAAKLVCTGRSISAALYAATGQSY